MNGDVARAHAQLYDAPDCQPALKKEKGTRDDKKTISLNLYTGQTWLLSVICDTMVWQNYNIRTGIAIYFPCKMFDILSKQTEQKKL